MKYQPNQLSDEESIECTGYTIEYWYNYLNQLWHYKKAGRTRFYTTDADGKDITLHLAPISQKEHRKIEDEIERINTILNYLNNPYDLGETPKTS